MSLGSENNQRILSHNPNSDALEEVIESIRQRIRQTGDKPHVSVARQLELLDEFAAFDYGRFMIQNKGLNGYWT